MGATNIFPHAHKTPDESKDHTNDHIVADEPRGEHYLGFFSRGSRKRKNAAFDASRTVDEPLMNTSKPKYIHHAYESEEEEMIERLVETQD